MSNQQCLLMVSSLQSWHMNQPKSILFDLVMFLTLCLTTSFRPLDPKFLPSEDHDVSPPIAHVLPKAYRCRPTYMVDCRRDNGVWVCESRVCYGTLLLAQVGVGSIGLQFCGSPQSKDFPNEFPRRKARVSFGSFRIFILTLPPYKQKERKVTNTVL